MKSCDLQLEPRSIEEAEAMAMLLAAMGVGVAAFEAEEVDRARAYAEAAKRHGIEAYTRRTIEAKSWADALKEIARAEARGYDIVAVRPRSAEAARLAARDPRVAIVQLPPGMARYMDRSQALMLREGDTVVEVRLLPLLRPGDPRAALRGAIVITRRAAAYGAAFILSSGARTRWELWSPASARGLLEAFGVPPHISLLALTGYCRQALRKRLASAAARRS